MLWINYQVQLSVVSCQQWQLSNTLSY